MDVNNRSDQKGKISSREQIVGLQREDLALALQGRKKGKVQE